MINRLSQWSGIALLVLGVIGCSVPRRTLDNNEKQADLQWIRSIFNENYGPMEYKESLHEFQFSESFATFSEEAETLNSNSGFYSLVHRFIALFKDAHTSGSFFPSSLPGRASVAYLGFGVERTAGGVAVQSFLPTMQGIGNPVQDGDVITHLNGISIDEAISSEITPYRDLGHDQANLTVGAGHLFFRFSLYSPIPSDTWAHLTIKRGGQTIELKLPWIFRDYTKFIEEQYAASKEQASDENEISDARLMEYRKFSTLYEMLQGNYPDLPIRLANLIPARQTFKAWNTFQFVDLRNPLTSAFWQDVIREKVAEEDSTNDDGESSSTDSVSLCSSILETRVLPVNAIKVPTSCFNPAYIIPADQNGQILYSSEERESSTGSIESLSVLSADLKGYIRIPTFSPSGAEQLVIDEFKNTLRFFKSYGIKDLTIDTIDNGGGSLSLGVHLAQALMSEKIALPTIQVNTSDSWIDQFEHMATSPDYSDSIRELYQRMFQELMNDRHAGRSMSRHYSMDELFPFAIHGNPDITEPFNITLLINEMCASMCDIYAGMLKDNGMATLAGSRTMGAGGNVAMYMLAPNSNLLMSQTESLIRRSNGEYIENIGVTPHVNLATHEFRADKFTSILNSSLNGSLRKDP